MGHALALGVNIDDWYRSKSNRILISKQDYLDNLVWLYGKIRKYSISDCEDAVLYIEKRFSEYFNDIYLYYMHKEFAECFDDIRSDYTKIVVRTQLLNIIITCILVLMSIMIHGN